MKAVDNAVVIAENCMHDAILTLMDKVVIPRVEMAVKAITGSSGHGPNSEVQNLDQRVFLGNAGNNPLMSASRRLDINTKHDRNDGTRNEENFEDDDFPSIRPNYDWRAQAHHIFGPMQLLIQGTKPEVSSSKNLLHMKA